MDREPRPTLTLYRRADCGLCDDARAVVQLVLEERAARGEPTPSVAEVDVDATASLAERYGSTVPVLELDGTELPLATSPRAIRRFIDLGLGRLV
jgi:glutaredoxin